MKYGFIGCGNMGGAIARALRKSTSEIMISDPSKVGEDIAAELNCAYVNNETLIQNCDRIFLAVKPQIMEQVLLPLRDLFKQYKPQIITIAAGLSIEKIEGFIGTKLPIIRIMPNTPVMVGSGMIQYCFNELITAEDVESFLNDMQYAGRLDQIPENLIDAASALSGCGPAFMYMFIEALADGAVACGLPRAKAQEYAAATMAGAAKMVLETGKHPGELKDAVCSPGGSTIVGVKTLEEHGLRSAAIDCVVNAYNKSKQLG